MVPLLTAGEVDWMPYFNMPFVEGQSLRERLAPSEPQLPVTDFGVAKAVDAASTMGAEGITTVGLALGTPAYMAPGRATADPLTDHRADIYA